MSGRTHVSSGAVVYKLDAEVPHFLVMRRALRGTMHLPKGTRSGNESLEETALREIQEETGYRVTLENYLGALPSTFEREGEMIQKETHYFVALADDAPVQAPDAEHDEITFLPYEEAHALLLQGTWKEEEWRVLEWAARKLRERERLQ